MEQNNEVVVDNEETTDTLDTPSGEVNNTEVTSPAQPQAPQIDFAALYRESLQERNRLQAEAESLRNVRTAPQEEEITDDHLEKFGTTATIKKIVGQTLREQLKDSLGDIGLISQDYKRGKQLNEAENTFFQQFPQVSQFREGLSQIVRQALQNAPNVDSNTYSQAALSAIGMYQLNSMTQQNNAPANQSPPSRSSAPVPRSNGTVQNASVPRLTEIERKAMRNAGFDPNKRDDYDSFMKIVNNDEGVTV